MSDSRARTCGIRAAAIPCPSQPVETCRPRRGITPECGICGGLHHQQRGEAGGLLGPAHDRDGAVSQGERFCETAVGKGEGGELHVHMGRPDRAAGQALPDGLCLTERLTRRRNVAGYLRAAKREPRKGEAVVLPALTAGDGEHAFGGADTGGIRSARVQRGLHRIDPSAWRNAGIASGRTSFAGRVQAGEDGGQARGHLLFGHPGGKRGIVVHPQDQHVKADRKIVV